MSGKAFRWIAGLLFVATVIWALRLIGPAIPHEIRILTGPEGTTFYEDALRYQEYLGRHGVDVQLQETSGSVENLQTLIEGDIPTAAFAWGFRNQTSKRVEVPEGIESLGTMYLQPLWVFVNKDIDHENLRGLRGSRIEAGDEGSDGRLLALFILGAEGVGDEVDFGENHPDSPEELVKAVESDRIAAFIAVGKPDSELIDLLLRSPELQVMSITRAEAISIQYPFLKVVRFPEGAHDLGANLPDQDLQLLAARTQLVVSDPFPPAVADLLLQAASEIHGGATPFSTQGEFPSRNTAPLPLSRAADNFYTNGPSKLQNFLPFRLAALTNRFLAAGVAIGSAAITLFRLLPALLGLPFKLKVRRGYADLRALEKSAAAGADNKTVLEELARVDQFTANMRIPLHKVDSQWIELRQFLHDMRDRLTES